MTERLRPALARTPRSITIRSAGTLSALVCLAMVASGCAGGSHGSQMEPTEARRSVIDLVDRSATALGGTWTVVERPSVSSCPNGGGDHRGAWYTYSKNLSSTGDREEDLEIVDDLWSGLGLAVGRVGSSSTARVLSVIAKGDHGFSVRLTAIQDHYTLSGTSECMDRDPDPLRSPADLFPEDP